MKKYTNPIDYLQESRDEYLAYGMKPEDMEIRIITGRDYPGNETLNMAKHYFLMSRNIDKVNQLNQSQIEELEQLAYLYHGKFMPKHPILGAPGILFDEDTYNKNKNAVMKEIVKRYEFDNEGEEDEGYGGAEEKSTPVNLQLDPAIFDNSIEPSNLYISIADVNGVFTLVWGKGPEDLLTYSIHITDPIDEPSKLNPFEIINYIFSVDPRLKQSGLITSCDFDGTTATLTGSAKLISIYGGYNVTINGRDMWEYDLP